MADLTEKIDEILKTIPFDKIRENSFEVLRDGGVLIGERDDIEMIIMEQIEQFKADHGKRVQRAVWDATYRQVRKILGARIKEWYDERLAEAFNESVIKAIESKIDEKATEDAERVHEEMDRQVKEMTDELVDIGGEG